MKNVTEFLRESNAIEGVYDDVSLKQAKEAWKYLIKQKVLTPDVVLKTHKILMLHQNLQPDEKGYFRRCQVWVGRHQGVRWEKLELEIEDWCEVANMDKTECTEKEVIDSHIRYEAIHPFVDGNGRTGRLFLNWQRAKAGLPILVIREAERRTYYTLFQ